MHISQYIVLTEQYCKRPVLTYTVDGNGSCQIVNKQFDYAMNKPYKNYFGLNKCETLQ